MIEEFSPSREIERTYRSLGKGNSLDLLKDSLPCRELNPENLVLECTCNVRDGQQVAVSAREAESNNDVPDST